MEPSKKTFGQQKKIFKYKWDNPEYFKEIDILGLLPTKKLMDIEKDFPKKDLNTSSGLQLLDFLVTMHQHLNLEGKYIKDEKEREIYDIKVTLNLIALFNEIDVNGDGTLEWEEFSDHIIQLGLIKKDSNISGIIKSYNLNRHIQDNVKHETEISQLYFFDEIQYILLLEENSPKLTFYNSYTLELIQIVHKTKGAQLAADYIPIKNLIVTTTNLKSIQFWDASTFNLKQRISTPEIQLCVRYIDWNQKEEPLQRKDIRLLYTGGSDSIVHVFELENFQEKQTLSGWNPFFDNNREKIGHSGPITNILAIHEQKIICTCSLDKQICLWDYPNHTFRKSLRGHKKGLFSLDERNQLLVSAGMDPDIFVWNPYVNNHIFKLSDHAPHTLVGVKILDGSCQLVSIDVDGGVKIWDFRTFVAKYNFNTVLKKVNCFCLTYPYKRIIIGGERLEIYDYDEPKDQLLTDEKYCLKVVYNNALFTFITLHPDKVAVWNALTGECLIKHDSLSKYDLTDICLDSRQRKLFVGDANGNIIAINASNGSKMMDFDQHTEKKKGVPITSLLYMEDEHKNKLLSAATCRSINVHEDYFEKETKVKTTAFTIRQHTNIITGMSLRNTLKAKYLASCSHDGSIIITYLRQYKTDRIYQHPDKEGAFEQVKFLNPHECIMAIDNKGKFFFWAIKPSLVKDTLLGTRNYQTKGVQKDLQDFYVSCFDYYEKKRWLILGDEFGNITIWSIKHLLDHLDFLKLDKWTVIQKWINTKEENFFSTQIDSAQKKYLIEANQIEMAKFYDNEVEKMTKTEFYKDFDKLWCQDVWTSFKAHDDRITSIEIMEQYGYFATSSFDCCVKIWSLDAHKVCIGSLIQGENLT